MISRWLKLGALMTVVAATLSWMVRKLLGSPRPAEDTPPSPPSEGKRPHEPKHRLLKIGAVLLALMVGGFLVALSGIIPIKASSGHWPVTAWFLNFSKERSVATHTLGMTTPALDEPWLVLKGAGHFEIGCRPCHGSPSLPYPHIAWHMTPPPPYLPPRLSKWNDAELFYIVKHGIKFTGMPAWPAIQRDDEVWAMVAFLRKLPKLNAEEYQRLAGGDVGLRREIVPLEGLLLPENVSRAINTSCARCHGADGLGRGLGAFPKIAGQKPAYLERSMLAFARGERHSGIMQPIAAGLNRDEIRLLAQYYANLPSSSPQTTPPFQPGQVIAHRGIPSQQVPACAACHGPNRTRRNPIYPELHGQYADYLLLQLGVFKKGARGGTDYAHIMHQVASRLTAEQMRDVASYYASLASTPASEASSR